MSELLNVDCPVCKSSLVADGVLVSSWWGTSSLFHRETGVRYGRLSIICANCMAVLNAKSEQMNPSTELDGSSRE